MSLSAAILSLLEFSHFKETNIYSSFLCTHYLGGVIAGAVIGVLAVASLSGLLAFFLYRRWKKNKEERKVEPEENGGENPVSQKPPVSTSLN